LGFYSSITRLLLQTFFVADRNVAIERPRVLCDYGLFPDVQTFHVFTACPWSSGHQALGGPRTGIVVGSFRLLEA
jgi:hypothetical protein